MKITASWNNAALPHLNRNIPPYPHSGADTGVVKFGSSGSSELPGHGIAEKLSLSAGTFQIMPETVTVTVPGTMVYAPVEASRP